MKNVKNKLLLATAIMALASCSENTYLGPEGTEGGAGAISFEYELPSATRGEKTGAEAAEKLGYSFQVYATKTVGETTSNVFAQNTYSTETNTPYWVWYNENTANTTTSNTANWEYVGAAGTHGTTGYTVTLETGKDQYIKYWDESATQYDFVAFKANKVTEGSTTAAATITNITTNGFTVTGTPAQLAALYIADKKICHKDENDYKKVVQLKFRNAATKVRLGIYETVPGYHVRNIKFKYTEGGSEKTSPENTTGAKTYAILNGKFIGDSKTSKTLSVTYDETSKKAILTPSSETSDQTTLFDFGEFPTGNTTYLGETATEPTWANTNPSSQNYTAVLPNTAAGNIDEMTLKIDFELYNDKSGEVIAVTNKTAVVPAEYMTWKSNYAYTYLFKISDKTGDFYPITLDAVVIEDETGKQETITTVTEPSITTIGVKGGVYSVGKNEYETGTDIYATITTSAGVVQDPTGKYFVYTATGSVEISEASVADAIAKKAIGIVTTPAITIANYTTNVTLSATVPNAHGGDDITLTSPGKAIKMASVSPAGNYVVAYRVSDGSATATADAYDATKTYYSVTADDYGFYPIVATIPTTDLDGGNWKDATAQAKYTTAPIQPVYIYKVIKVVAP